MIVATPAMTSPSPVEDRTGALRDPGPAAVGADELDLLVGDGLAADGSGERPVRRAVSSTPSSSKPRYASPPAIWWRLLRGIRRISSSRSLARTIRPLGASAIIRPSGTCWRSASSRPRSASRSPTSRSRMPVRATRASAWAHRSAYAPMWSRSTWSNGRASSERQPDRTERDPVGDERHGAGGAIGRPRERSTVPRSTSASASWMSGSQTGRAVRAAVGKGERDACGIDAIVVDDTPARSRRSR